MTICKQAEVSIFSFSTGIVCMLIPVNGVPRIGISEQLKPEEKRFFSVLMCAYNELGYKSVIYKRGDTICPEALQLASGVLNEPINAGELTVKMGS